MKVVMAEGKNLKKIRVTLQDGQVKPGPIENYLGHNVGGTTSPDRLAETTKEIAGDKTPKKICLGCSDPAIEDKDYCSACIVFIK